VKSISRQVDVDRLLAAAGFAFIFAASIIIARTPPATGFELSIYNAYPAVFWVFIAVANASGIGILVHQAFARERSDWWLAGLCVIILSTAVLLGLSYFRGYGLFSGGDAMTHVGMMKDIGAAGHLGVQNHYPILHLLGVSLLNITGLDYAPVTNLLFVVFSAAYLLKVYLLATVVAKNRGQALLMTAFAAPLIFSFRHRLIHPSMLSIFMLPLLLYFYHRATGSPVNKAQNMALLFVVAALMTLFHPITALFAVAVLFVFAIAAYVHRRVTTVTNPHPVPATGKTGAKLALVAAAVVLIFFSSWYLSFPSIGRNVRSVYNWLAYQITASDPDPTPVDPTPVDPTPVDPTPVEPPVHPSLFQSLMQQLFQADVSFSQAANLFVARYGPVFIYLLTALTLSILTFRKVLGRKFKRRRLEPLEFAYSVQFVVALLISTYMLFGYAIEFEPVRIARFPLLMGTILSGLVVYSLFAGYSRSPLDIKGSRRLGFTAITGALLIVASVLSVFSVHNSPWVVRENSQVTHMDIAGSAWFSSHRHADIAIAQSGVTLFRLDHFNFGVETSAFEVAPRRLPLVPSHFAYDENHSIAEALGFQDTYLLTSERGRMWALVVPEAARHHAHQYTAEDLARLRADAGVVWLYTNGEFEVWKVYGEEQG